MAAMQELSNELGHFIGGSINLDQLRAAFRAYLAQHQDQRESIARWLKDTVDEGRLSVTVWLSLRDLFDGSPARAAPTSSQQATELASPRRRSTDRSEHAQRHVTHPASGVPLFEPDYPVQPTGDSLHIGAVVRDRFVLVEQLGRGGMGQVFKARDLRREEAHDRHPFIALKILNKEVSANPDSFMALQREARRASTLAHPNVVTVYDFDRDGARIYMTMEYLEGRGLDSFLREDCTKGLPLAQVWPIIRDIALALEYGHQKRIVHSDLKPANIFLCKDGTVKVLDFGIARLINPAEARDHTLFDPALVLSGLTPAYASLEMWNREAPDPRDDVYALACVTYELLCGRHPFDRESAKTAVERELTPQRIEALTRSQWDGLKKGLALLRENRTPTIREFIAPFAPQRRRRRRYALPAIAVAAFATVAAVAVGARYYRVAVEDSTIQVLQCAQIPQPPAPKSVSPVATPTPEQERAIEDYVVLARDYLSDITPTMSIDAMKSIVSDGANNVNDILDAALRIDPAREEVLKLKSDAANLYASRARLLLNRGQAGEALDLVRYARHVQPGSQDLFRLEQQICRAQAVRQAQN